MADDRDTTHDDLGLDQTLEGAEAYDEAHALGTDEPQERFPLEGPLTDPAVVDALNRRSAELGELVRADDASSTVDGGVLVGAEDGSDSPEEAALHVVGGDAVSERDVTPRHQDPPQ
jgi:hypothetical protein